MMSFKSGKGRTRLLVSTLSPMSIWPTTWASGWGPATTTNLSHLPLSRLRDAAQYTPGLIALI